MKERNNASSKHLEINVPGETKTSENIGPGNIEASIIDRPTGEHENWKCKTIDVMEKQPFSGPRDINPLTAGAVYILFL